MSRWRIALLAALAGQGCAESGAGSQRDAGEELSQDTGIDAMEASRDVVDASVDIQAEASDAGNDASVDVAMDVAIDVAADVAMDVAADVAADNPPAPVDVATGQGPPPCPGAQSRCDGACVDTATATSHCGRCGAECPARSNAAPTCAAGACRLICNAGYADCDGDASNGCEAALDGAETCGACGTRCQEPTPLCQESAGRHTCVSGCSGAASARCAMSCVDTRTDARHCGACDRACSAPANARATCTAGTCGFSCNAGYHACGATCADDAAVASCGTLCVPCPTRPNATATCGAGSCGFTCSAGFANCDGDASNGCEADLAAETSCGACGTGCTSSSRCARGGCEPCSALAPSVGGRAEVADAVPLRLASGSFTIEAWLFANGYTNRCQNAIATKRGSGTADGWFFSVTGRDCGVSAGRLYFQVSGGNDPNVIANTAAPLGRWFHAAATYDAGARVLTLWQDGASVGSGTLPPPSATTAAPMFIGNDSDGQPYTWNGHIDDLRISLGVRYTGAFTAPAQLANDGSVLGLWRFQESTGVAMDASPNGHVARFVMADREVSPAVCRP